MRYLSQRSSGIWYFRYQIPPKFRSHFSGQTEYKRSLHTRCRYTAKLRSAELQQRLWKNLVLIEQNINENNEERTSVDGFLKFFQLNERNVFGFSDELKRKIVKRLTHCLEVLESQPNLVRAQLRRIELQNEDSSDFIGSVDIIESLCNRNITPLHAAERYLSRLPFADNPRELHYSEEIRNIAITLFRHVYNFQQCLDALDVEGARTILSRIEEYEWRDINKSYSQLTTEDYLQSSLLEHETNTTTVNTNTLSIRQTETEKVVDIELVLESYELERLNQGCNLKEIKAVKASCRLVHDLLGSNNMANVSRQDANRVIPYIKLFPKNARTPANRKHFGDLGTKEIIEKNQQLGLPLRSEEQSLRDIGRVSTLYKWAKENEIITYNPFVSLSGSKSNSKSKAVSVDDVDTEKTKKDPFNEKDLQEIFSHHVYKRGKFRKWKKQRLNCQYWVPLIALTTGARPNEICQLNVKDVEVREGILCLLIQTMDDDQSVKSVNAIRIVPVPNKLLELGFADYLESVKHERKLFPDLTYTDHSGYYGKVEDWFTRTFTKPMSLTEQSKSFYSFRHTFIFDYQKRSARCSIINYLIGHKNGSIADDTYGGKFPIKLLKDKIEEFGGGDVLTDVLRYKPEEKK